MAYKNTYKYKETIFKKETILSHISEDIYNFLLSFSLRDDATSK